MSAPDANGWFEWRGGECPVASGTKIEIRLRADAGSSGSTNKPQNLRWSHRRSEEEAGSGDIVAYREVAS